MTTGERLVSISTLSSDTALQHFLNINTGTGGSTIILSELDISSGDGVIALVVNDDTITVNEPTPITNVDDDSTEVEVKDDNITIDVS
jgi:arginine repressor